nr:single-stranded DNA-binding protein UL29 [Psittacid alphaherpesvirus 6]
METARKGVQVRGGPIGFLYARNRSDLESDPVLSLLSAKSVDSDAVVMPLLKGVTVENGFCTNVAAVSGCKTTGLGGGCGTSVKLLPTHYCPAVFGFYGFGAFSPSVLAPNLTIACENARKRYGFSPYTVPCPNAEETTGEELCSILKLNPDETALYLVVTEAFKEAVYLCNVFLHYGGVEKVIIATESGPQIDEDEKLSQRYEFQDEVDLNLQSEENELCHSRTLLPGTALRLPLYPLQLYTPDFNRVNVEPFNKRHRAIGDNCEFPKALFNDALCRLLHGYVLGPAAVALRVRNLDAIARGTAHLSFDDGHEGVVLPNDVTFPLLDYEVAMGGATDGYGTGNGLAPTGGSVGPMTTFAAKQTSGGRVGSFMNGGKKGPVVDSGDSVMDTHQYGLERRTASIMASDVTIAIESAISTAVYEDTASDLSSWPMFTGGADKTSALASYLGRVSGLVGAMVFAPNSALYMTEVEDAWCRGNESGSKDSTQPSFYRFYQIAAPHQVDGPLVDREGRHVGTIGGKSSVSSNRNTKRQIPSSGAGDRGGYNDYQLDYMAMACGFCPQILAKLLFYVERCDAGASAFRYDSDALRHAVSAIDSDVHCEICTQQEIHKCARTTIHRLRHRLPKFGNNQGQMRGSLCLFGTTTNIYSDTDPLGSYAPFSALKRGDGEAARTVIQDTYRVTAERLMAELDAAGLIDKEDPIDHGGADKTIVDGRTFMEATAAVRTAAEREASQLMHNLVYSRDFKIREGLADANHTVYLAIEPYSSGLCPLLAFLHRRSTLAVIQDMALSQCSHLIHGQQVEARNFRTQFQSVLRKRVMDMQNAGFLSSRPTTVILAEPCITAPNPSAPQNAPPARDVDGDLVRVNVDVLRELKIKNRVMFFGASTAASEAAKARAAGMADAYQRPSRRLDILSGPLGFALKRYHDVLFPNGRPGGGKQVNSINHTSPTCIGNGAVAAQWFWSMLQRNQMPARVLKKEDVDVICFVKRFSDEYADSNFINATPTCMAELAQFVLANSILKLCDHKTFFITSVTALTAQCKRPKDPSAVLPWINAPATSGAELERMARSFVETVDERSMAWTSVFQSTNMVRHVMTTKPMLVIGVSVSKYQGVSGSVRVFQSGNWGTVLGGKNVCPLMRFDKTRRYVLTCPRVGFVTPKTVTYTSGVSTKESTVADVAKGIISEGGVAPHAAIFIAALKAIGVRVKDMDEHDWLTITEDSYLAAALCEINAAAAAAPGGWSVESADAAAKESIKRAENGRAESGEVTFDFGCCTVAQDGSTVAVDPLYDVPTGDIAGDRASDSPAPRSVIPSLKRGNFSDPLFEMDPMYQPPLDKVLLTTDML